MKSQNNDIQFFKFLYCWVIVCYHLKNDTSGITCPGGSFGVEYFLMSSGIFLFSAFERQKDAGRIQTPGQYLWKRFSRFFAWSLTAYLFAAIVNYGIIDPVRSAGQLMDHFASDIWEILMIKWNGMNDGRQLLNGPAWTLSSLCIVGFLIWGCLYYYGERFRDLFMPLTIILGYGLWRHLEYAGTEAWIGFTAFGTFRTWLVICLSYYVVLLAKKLNRLPLNRLGMGVMTLAEVLLHMWSLWIMFNRSSRYYQWLATLLLMMALAIAFSERSLLVKWLNGSRLVNFLGEWSLSVFLTHMPVIQLYRWVFDIENATLVELTPLFLAIIGASILHLWITKWLLRLVQPLFRRIGAMMIEA